jgi:hypothetical protein
LAINIEDSIVELSLGAAIVEAAREDVLDLSTAIWLKRDPVRRREERGMTMTEGIEKSNEVFLICNKVLIRV